MAGSWVHTRQWGPNAVLHALLPVNGPPRLPWATCLEQRRIVTTMGARSGSRPVVIRLFIAMSAAVVAAACVAQGSVRSPASVGAPTSPTARAPNVAVDWPTYHGDDGRTGLASSFPPLAGGLTQAWSAALDGAVYGEPLGVQGRVIVATEGDSVYALDPATGLVAWRQHLGIPVPMTSLPCGDIDPLGITSTPVYDPATGSLFVVAEVAGPKHVLYALDATTGAVRWSRGVDRAGDDPNAHQQRGALALANGYVYTGFGGLFGDCGAYRGEVVGVPTTGNGTTITY